MPLLTTNVLANKGFLVGDSVRGDIMTVGVNAYINRSCMYITNFWRIHISAPARLTQGLEGYTLGMKKTCTGILSQL